MVPEGSPSGCGEGRACGLYMVCTSGEHGTAVSSVDPGRSLPALSPLSSCAYAVDQKPHPAAARALSKLALTLLEKGTFYFIVLSMFTRLSLHTLKFFESRDLI